MMAVVLALLILGCIIGALIRFAIGFIAGARAVIRGDLEPEDDQWPDT